MRYFKKLESERLYLSPINPDDVELYTKWINDPEVSTWLSLHSQLISLSRERKILEELSETGCCFAIILKEGDRLLGNISLMNFHHTNRTAEMGVFLGEADDRSLGYGEEAIRLVLAYGFKTLNLHNIMLHVNADNARAIACYKKCGFVESGHRREAIFWNGRYVDRISMDVLSNEIESHE
ncbi:MAG: GNAT family N-acetyltransferase [Oscillospiraceae bacterium]|nr:GNAT family N-acetyltransferase [Oscillospiraceae bacterium]